MKTVQGFSRCSQIVSHTWKAIEKAKDSQMSISANKTEWAQLVLGTLKINLTVVGTPTVEKSLLLLGNHVSYLDIPVLMSASPDLSFVAKKELSRWPIFGRAAQQIQTVFVQREHGPSRKLARQAIHQALDEGRRVVIFPSGTTSLSEAKPWKKGAFEIAFEKKLLVQPFRISYQPLRPVAYIDRDFFPIHLFKLGQFDRIDAVLEFHPPVQVDDPLWDCLNWNLWSRGLISNRSLTHSPRLPDLI